MAGLRSLLLILMIWEFFCDGIVIVDNCCSGAIIGVMPDISKIFAVLADAFDGRTASTINGAMSSDFFNPEYLIRGWDVFGTVANNN